MTPFEAYQTYLAIKTHFNREEYDYFKFNKRMKSASHAAFEKRPDNRWFKGLANKASLEDYLVANLVQNSRFSVANMDEGEAVYLAWKARQESLTYLFTQQLPLVWPTSSTSINEPFQTSKDSEHPRLLKLLLGKHISIEVFMILDDIWEGEKYWHKIKEDLVWPAIRLKVEKYRPFLNYDKNKFINLLNGFFINSVKKSLQVEGVGAK